MGESGSGPRRRGPDLLPPSLRGLFPGEPCLSMCPQASWPLCHLLASDASSLDTCFGVGLIDWGGSSLIRVGGPLGPQLAEYT